MEVAFPPPILAAQSHLRGKLAAKYNATPPPPPPPAELEQADFLAIDDLLDFSNEDIGGPIETCPVTRTSCELKVEAPPPLAFDRKMASEPGGFDSDSLCVPCDDLAELEWLSNFVAESFSSSDASSMAAYISLGDGGDGRPAHCRSSTSDEESFRTTSPVSVLESHAFSIEKNCPPFAFSSDTSSIPARARSKRCRNAVCLWNTQILCAEASESLLETPSQAVRAASSEPKMHSPYYDNDDDDEEQARDGAVDDSPFLCFRPNDRASNPSMKSKSPSDSKANGAIKKHLSMKPKKMKADDALPTRKCLHCATQKTPQWRAGPLGPKTLCNACGVRYKSGRLCNEYRPAASPTFMESLHSNSHRKVLEMRKQKRETGNGQESQKHSSNYSEGHSLNSVGRVSVNTEE